MKQGKNPTRRQKQNIASIGLNQQNWLVCARTPRTSWFWNAR
ncbi:MAG: hypothetical protein V8T38_00040 [Oscillospiraceae bacterium]